MFENLVEKNRSCRRFAQSPAPSNEELTKLISLARKTPSSANLQPLQYVLVTDEKKRREVFSTLTWAGYLTDWAGPVKSEEPTAYIVILSNPLISRSPLIDVGIVSQTILLGATELGYNGCCLGSVDRPKLREYLQIPNELEIHLVIALGSLGEEISLETSQDIKYWRGEDNIHYVPKRPLEDLILKRY